MIVCNIPGRSLSIVASGRVLKGASAVWRSNVHPVMIIVCYHVWMAVISLRRSETAVLLMHRALLG